MKAMSFSLHRDISSVEMGLERLCPRSSFFQAPQSRRNRYFNESVKGIKPAWLGSAVPCILDNPLIAGCIKIEAPVGYIKGQQPVNSWGANHAGDGSLVVVSDMLSMLGPLSCRWPWRAGFLAGRPHKNKKGWENAFCRDTISWVTAALLLFTKLAFRIQESRMPLQETRHSQGQVCCQ